MFISVHGNILRTHEEYDRPCEKIKTSFISKGKISCLNNWLEQLKGIVCV